MKRLLQQRERWNTRGSSRFYSSSACWRLHFLFPVARITCSRLIGSLWVQLWVKPTRAFCVNTGPLTPQRHAVLSSMNASLLDLSLCSVLGGRRVTSSALQPLAAPSLPRRRPRTVTVTTLCFCLFTNADYNLCFISCITEFFWVCWRCTGGGGGGWCCMPLHSCLGLFV